MEVYKQLDSIPFTNGNVVTIGTFDGCHRGHQDIIKKVTSHANSIDGKSVIITFDPHPRHVLQTKDKLPILMHIDKKLEIFESLHIDVALIIPFNTEFSKMNASIFLKTIIESAVKISKMLRFLKICKIWQHLQALVLIQCLTCQNNLIHSKAPEKQLVA